MLQIRQPSRPVSTAAAIGVVAVMFAATAAAQQASVPSPVSLTAEDLSLTIENSHLGYTYVGEGGMRYFVTQLHLTNGSDRARAVPLSSIELLVDGVAFGADPQFPRLTGYDFRVNGRSYRFRDLERTESITLSAGTSGTAWIVFTNLPKTADVPQLELRVELPAAEQRIDITAHYDQALKLDLQRIGPRGALGLLTIDGRLNSISVGTLVDTIDQLAASGITRIVVSFSSQATELDEPLGSWLRQTAEGVQTSRTYAMYPAAVSTVRQLHVANVPGRARDESATHIHGSTASAVESALASAFRGLTSAEIAAEIESGHPLSQAAALVNGGGDLSSDYLRLLLDRANSDNALLRRGALIALSDSGNPEAITALTTQAQQSDPAVAALALECLAASRFAGAHEQLERLLGKPLAVDESTIVRILARYPRPHWGEYLSALAIDANDTVAADVRSEVIRALGRIGHPQLTQILADALQESDSELQQTAFGLMLMRHDAECDQLALTYALNQLAQSPPTPTMLQLFDRVRDPRTAPLLMPYLDSDDSNKTALINTLARIGPADVDDELARRYPKFNPNEQAAVLSNLLQLRSSRLLPLAESGLASENHAVFNAASRSLGLLDDDSAALVLASRLDSEDDIDRVRTLAKTLADIGLPSATRALEQTRNSSSGDKRLAISDTLRSLWMQSPGGKYLELAEAYVSKNEQQKAIELYTQALERDPDMAPAYSGRGHVHLKLEDLPQAEADFRRCIELDADDGLAVTGLGITLAISGETDEAVKLVERASERFTGDPLFAYNAACVYGRVLERISTVEDVHQQPDRQRQLERSALTRLRSSIKLGFTDLDWMQEDPDLASLRHLDEFQQLIMQEQPDDENRQLREPDRREQIQQPLPGEQ